MKIWNAKLKGFKSDCKEVILPSSVKTPKAELAKILK